MRSLAVLPEEDGDWTRLPELGCRPPIPGLIEPPGVRGPVPVAEAKSATDDPGLTPLENCKCEYAVSAPCPDAKAAASPSIGPSYKRRMTGRALVSLLFDLLLLPKRNVPELVNVAFASPPSRLVKSRANASILLPAPSFFLRVLAEDSEFSDGVEAPGSTPALRSVVELVASLAARSCRLGVQAAAVESLEGARDSCGPDAKGECAGDAVPL